MKPKIPLAPVIMLGLGGLVAYQLTTGTCVMCSIGNAITSIGTERAVAVRTVSETRTATAASNTSSSEESGAQPAQPGSDEFQTVRRPGSVDIDEEYNLSGLQIPKDEIHTLLPRDAIPALTDPKRQKVSDASWLTDDARILVVSVNNEVLGVPLSVLDWHEIVNTTVGGEPIAATYCPLCDSATVFNRRVDVPGEDEPVVLEFGVSGALYNSNVLMYDRKDRGLWSQLAMGAVSGPLAGTKLTMLPVEMVPLSTFKLRHPKAQIVSNETGHQRNYGQSPYTRYFASDGLMVPVEGVGDAMERKTLGVGVAMDGHAWFVPRDAIKDGYTLDTPAGPVKMTATEAGVAVESAPEGVRTAQTFYYSWSAFYPDTKVVTKDAELQGALPSGDNGAGAVQDAFARLRAHTFHPLDGKSFTIDRDLKRAGIADLDDSGWRVRLLAVRDLVRAGDDATPRIEDGLSDDDFQVRYAAATALGVLRAERSVPALLETLKNDPSLIVRAQTAVALGQIGSSSTLEPLRAAFENDESGDVRHQCELSIDQIEKGMHATPELRRAYESLDPSTFEQARVGQLAPDFTLSDTDGNTHTLSEMGGGWTVLVWVFADWCPVCHGEFRELIAMQSEFERAGVRVMTIETHDTYRARVMVGKEVDPQYWFSDESFQDQYTERIWWPHLMDRAGAVGASYGIDPMAFAVHAEYINRPSTFIIDPEGKLRFAYVGTFWGDRPSIEETLEMIHEESFDYRNPRRLTP